MINNQDNAQSIKKSFHQLAEDIQVPDANESIDKLGKRIAARKRKQFAIVALILIGSLSLGAAVSEPVRGFPEYLRKTFTLLIGDTLELHQRGHEEDFEIIESDYEVFYYTNLDNLRAESIANIYIPASHLEEEFVYAEMHSDDNNIFMVEMEFWFDEQHEISLTQYISEYVSSQVRIVDVEDYETKVLNIKGQEVMVYSHKSGLTILEWEESAVTYELSGHIELDELLAFADLSGLFN